MQQKQKVSKALIFRSGVFLLALWAGICAEGQEVSASNQGVLEYSSRSPVRTKPLVLTGDYGVKYRLFLAPELDTQQHVVVLELSLRRLGSKSDKPNLLEPPGTWHGDQPFFFAASDFVRDANATPSDTTRVIDVPRLGIRLQIKVAGVDVESISPESSPKLPYQFNELTLQIASRSLSQIRPKT